MHYEMREASVYALVMAKPGKLGPQLRPHPVDAPCANQFPVDQDGRAAPQKQQQADADGFPTICRGVEGVPAKMSGDFAFGARDVSMKLLATSLAAAAEHLGRPIIDQTGLTGNYDFRMEWTEIAENSFAAPHQATAPQPADNRGPSFLEALTEQLGLKLKPQKGEVEEIVVEHLDYLSPN